ncbi:T9SS type A sorting domain-containing protein [Winogradskyella thalassocola]|uniref:Por secretion system C-terminal sorting domain-containing protein n=1 Tax=Winogradskyella thalassocola TaxID=262004 RepID=A0A1G7Z8Y2_9FLAO|nr:T9SS type A sorting domain-containing protein [Winogradskyella thalassocola]SDH05222.1 Por secretion system C-terminal sorting domain-containing protein [Winogradskyella thalassocola]
MKKITFFHEHLINTCFVSKTKLLFLFTLISALSYGQTFDWETGTLLSFGSSNQDIIAQQIVGGYEVDFSDPVNGTPILLGAFTQGTTGKAVMNQQPQQVVRLSFFPAIDIQSLKAFSADASSTNWTFTPNNSSGNAVVTANVAQNAVPVNLNWTNVSSIDISLTNGSSQNFGVDDIVFSPYTPCTVTIPDANFKAYLVGNTAINTNGDTEIQCSEASAFTGQINVNGLSISDLTGIETFTNLTELLCSNNALSSIDLTSNTQLTALGLAVNNLSSLDVSNNSLLTILTCFDNQLTSLNVANGNNAILAQMDAINNLDLTCIQIDTGFTPPTAWLKDATASYSDDCAALSVDDFNVNSISLQPNPTSSMLNIEMTQNIKQASVYSMLGKEVLKTRNKQIDVSRLSNGVFLIKIEDENGNVSTKRFIKQ